MTQSKACAIYIRVGSKAQASIETQRATFKRYAERNGWRVVRRGRAVKGGKR
jgi:hypothetical protein